MIVGVFLYLSSSGGVYRSRWRFKAFLKGGVMSAGFDCFSGDLQAPSLRWSSKLPSSSYRSSIDVEEFNKKNHLFNYVTRP